jgi:DNA repair exonuclease SbcCD ATPase subunit
VRKVVWVVIGLGVLAAVALTTSRARVEVAKDKVIAKIDSLLGTSEVRRKEIEHSVSALKDGLHGLQKAKIMAQVKHEQLVRQAEPVEREVAAIDASLGKLRNHLATQEVLLVGGKAYQSEDVKGMADTLIRRRKERLEQLDGLRTAQTRLQKVVTTLERKQAEYEKRLAGIESQLAVVDSNRVALKAMKDAARSMEASDKGLAENVAQLEDKVNNLYADVEAELRMEDAHWDTTGTRREMQSADDILKAVGSPKDTIAEIDDLLGKSKVASNSKLAISTPC